MDGMNFTNRCFVDQNLLNSIFLACFSFLYFWIYSNQGVWHQYLINVLHCQQLHRLTFQTFCFDTMLVLHTYVVKFIGAHTIGTAHCSSFRDHFQADSKGKLRLIDKNLDSNYANELMKQCPAGVQPSVTVNNDPETSMVFDNKYYQNLLAHKGLFQSDSVLLSNDSTRKLVEDFANDQDLFFENWRQSFLKLTSIGVKTGDEGEIRQSCASTNA